MAALTATSSVTPGSDTPHPWRVWVTEEDVRRARTAWVRARDGGAPAGRARDLLEEFGRLSRTATLQAAGDPWSGGGEVGPVALVSVAQGVPEARPEPLSAGRWNRRPGRREGHNSDTTSPGLASVAGNPDV